MDKHVYWLFGCGSILIGRNEFSTSKLRLINPIGFVYHIHYNYSVSIRLITLFGCGNIVQSRIHEINPSNILKGMKVEAPFLLLYLFLWLLTPLTCLHTENSVHVRHTWLIASRLERGYISFHKINDASISHL